MALLRINDNLAINADYVMYICWFRPRRADSDAKSFLQITMADGSAHTICHDPDKQGGADAHEIERRLLAAAVRPMVSRRRLSKNC